MKKKQIKMKSFLCSLLTVFSIQSTQGSTSDNYINELHSLQSKAATILGDINKCKKCMEDNNKNFATQLKTEEMKSDSRKDILSSHYAKQNEIQQEIKALLAEFEENRREKSQVYDILVKQSTR